MTPASNAPAAAAAADPLAGLRAYRLPEPVSWWPPAPGWWLLALLILALGALLAWWLLRRRRCRAAARQAALELGRLRSGSTAQADAGPFVRELSKLLRRFAIAAFPRREVASLTGEDWLRFLDRHGSGGRFTEGPGRQLARAPYRPDAAVDPEALAALVEDWIRRNREICP